MRVRHTRTWPPHLRIADNASGSDRLAFNASLPRPDSRRCAEGAFGPSSNGSDVINLQRYRRQRSHQYFHIADLSRPENSARAWRSARNAGFDKNYAERMKMNAAVFVFLVFFILSGIWLMDGLRQAFGH